MHPAILFLVIRFRLICYAAFKVHRQYNGIRNILSLYFGFWEMSEDSKHLISPVTLHLYAGVMRMNIAQQMDIRDI